MRILGHYFTPIWELSFNPSQVIFVLQLSYKTNFPNTPKLPSLPLNL